MSRAARDFWLAEHAPAIMDTVAGLAHATNEVLKGPKRHANKAHVSLATELAERFATQTILLQTFMLDYRPAMTEPELRAWADGLKASLTS